MVCYAAMSKHTLEEFIGNEQEKKDAETVQFIAGL